VKYVVKNIPKIGVKFLTAHWDEIEGHFNIAVCFPHDGGGYLVEQVIHTDSDSLQNVATDLRTMAEMRCCEYRVPVLAAENKLMHVLEPNQCVVSYMGKAYVVRPGMSTAPDGTLGLFWVDQEGRVICGSDAVDWALTVADIEEKMVAK
jgi:hypothetical protein